MKSKEIEWKTWYFLDVIDDSINLVYMLIFVYSSDEHCRVGVKMEIPDIHRYCNFDRWSYSQRFCHQWEGYKLMCLGAFQIRMNFPCIFHHSFYLRNFLHTSVISENLMSFFIFVSKKEMNGRWSEPSYLRYWLLKDDKGSVHSLLLSALSSRHWIRWVCLLPHQDK